jgi:hypothetical protein
MDLQQPAAYAVPPVSSSCGREACHIAGVTVGNATAAVGLAVPLT